MENHERFLLIQLVVPCFNEEANIIPFFEELDKADLAQAESDLRFEVIAVNDGSKDQTLKTLLEIQKERDDLTVIDLSRNFGKESALTAGLSEAGGDAVIPIDADGQHPFATISEMVALWRQGYDVVLAKRNTRDTDTRLQKWTARLFYKAHNQLSDINIPADVGDFRLMDKKVVRVLNQLPENRRFMKGLFAWVGFRTATVIYDVQPRSYGQTRFNTWKLWNLALEGITSFSISPLKIWTYVGVVVAFLSFLYASYLVATTLIYGTDLPGYPSIMVAVLFMGGIQLISIGIIGEYLGRVYIESKNRPSYIIADIYKPESKTDSF
ncbi:glycosyltransferase family 2 protein [Hydrogenovibrio halophilus]|uniref:glycosyltransferase family 2 protein n=1 Tax=Hydrogenovibrio halophilus TaxID=373391 RepID=UPI000378303D|nr:glycosyltransferase family 2 protein [Hydrogenovibrio halophilus]